MGLLIPNERPKAIILVLNFSPWSEQHLAEAMTAYYINIVIILSFILMSILSFINHFSIILL